MCQLVDNAPRYSEATAPESCLIVKKGSELGRLGRPEKSDLRPLAPTNQSLKRILAWLEKPSAGVFTAFCTLVVVADSDVVSCGS